MREFFNKIVADNIRYNNTLGIIIFILAVLILGFCMPTHSKFEYKFASGVVQYIKKGYYLEKRTPTFAPTRYVKKEGVEIIINDLSFFIDQNEKDQWRLILETVKQGDEISVLYYHFDDRNLNNVHELTIDHKKIISIEERRRPLKYFSAFMIIIFSVGVYLMFYLVLKRSKEVKKR